MEVLSVSSGSEEWYVGINGVPVGPVRLSELRRKAAGGFVDEESLVWREGFEEWVPLRTFPELVALLAEARGANVTPPPPSIPAGPVASKGGARPAGAAPTRPATSGQGPPAALPRPSPAPRAPTAPSAVASLSARNNVVPIHSRLATAERLDDSDLEPATERADAPPASADTVIEKAPPPTSRSTGVPASALSAAEVADLTGGHPAHPQQARQADGTGSVATRLPTVATALAAAIRGGGVAADGRGEGFESERARRRRLHPAAFAVIGLAGVLVGMVGSSFIISARQPAPAPILVTPVVPAAAANSGSAMGGATIPPVPAAEEVPGTLETVEVARSGLQAGRGDRGTVVARTTDKGTPSAVAAPLPLNLNGLTGVGGPTSGPGGPAKNAGGAMSAADVERVVQSHRAFVKRQCWEPALAGRLPGAPASARVVVDLSVAPDGHVASAGATGGDGYPSLATCVQGNVKAWKFPPSEGGAVNFPFVFAAQ